MKFSLLDLLSDASVTSSRIFDAVDWVNSLVTSTRRTPLRLTQPERISSPSWMLRGTLSPVSATVSSVEDPSTTFPSTGTFSPGLMTIISPISTSSGLTVMTAPSLSTEAVSGRMSIRCSMLFLLLPSAMPSNISPTWKNNITKTASGN